MCVFINNDILINLYIFYRWTEVGDATGSLRRKCLKTMYCWPRWRRSLPGMAPWRNWIITRRVCWFLPHSTSRTGSGSSMVVIWRSVHEGPLVVYECGAWVGSWAVTKIWRLLLCYDRQWGPGCGMDWTRGVTGHQPGKSNLYPRSWNAYPSTTPYLPRGVAVALMHSMLLAS